MDEHDLLDFEAYRARKLLSKYPILRKAANTEEVRLLAESLGLELTQSLRRKLMAAIRGRSQLHIEHPDVA